MDKNDVLKSLEDIALGLHRSTGRIPTDILDMIMKYQGIKFDIYKDKEKAKTVWRKFIVQSLLAPKIDKDIPDIVA
ncbi:MAG: hypothetical protein GY710_11970 [Desulfobacteraceae bacterium]|nr:hypothetical protein [Desulfobacteraceae bacterium]